MNIVDEIRVPSDKKCLFCCVYVLVCLWMAIYHGALWWRLLDFVTESRTIFCFSVALYSPNLPLKPAIKYYVWSYSSPPPTGVFRRHRTQSLDVEKNGSEYQQFAANIFVLLIDIRFVKVGYLICGDLLSFFIFLTVWVDLCPPSNCFSDTAPSFRLGVWEESIHPTSI